MLNMAQIKFCAVECSHQKTDPLAVADMCAALEWTEDVFKTVEQNTAVTVAFIKRLGWHVDPNANQHGFRVMPVWFNNDQTQQALNPTHIAQALNSLITHGQNLTAEESYYEFQKIHPFNDGNGRVGAILYNIWKGGTYLKYPVIPPRMFD